jgi:prepilin-type N-terminal cleavage/methylation domain-containing protein
MSLYKNLNSASSSAFSLIELLAVMAIISVMMAVSVPAFNVLKSTGDISTAAYDIASTLEQARAYAMANNTFVYVGFAERAQMDATKLGEGQILISAMGSKSGSRNFDSQNLVALTRMRKMPNVRLEDNIPNSGSLARPAVPSAYQVANDAFKAQDTFEAGGVTFSKIVQFDPRGMASVQARAASVSQWMEIGLAGAQGSSPNNAVVVLDGVTGVAKVYRP